MVEPVGERISVKLYRVEVITLLGLVFNEVKKQPDPAAIDWPLIRLLGVLARAARVSGAQKP